MRQAPNRLPLGHAVLRNRSHDPPNACTKCIWRRMQGFATHAKSMAPLESTPVRASGADAELHSIPQHFAVFVPRPRTRPALPGFRVYSAGTLLAGGYCPPPVAPGSPVDSGWGLPPPGQHSLGEVPPGNNLHPPTALIGPPKCQTPDALKPLYITAV